MAIYNRDVGCPVCVRHWMTLFLLCASCGCGSKTVGDDHKSAAVSDEARQCLAVIHQDDLPITFRVDAVRKLGMMREPGSVKPLLTVLSKRYDLLAVEIVHSLRDIGDPSALPGLLLYQEKCRKDGILQTGQLNATIFEVIRDLENNRQNRPERK